MIVDHIDPAPAGPGRRADRRSARALVALAAGLGLLATLVTATPPASAAPDLPDGRYVVSPRLEARATLSADYLASGPESGADATPANGRKGPFPGQVLPGFSAAVANGDGTYWAMPDNGFGTKANSRDFLLRIYLVRPRWEVADGGPGRIQVLRFVSLSDPNREIDFPIVRGDTRRRLLTGGDFDIESLQRAPDGTFWIGDEFGPFLLHADARGRLLSAPIPSPLGGSPQSPLLGDATPTTQPSGGFEATARSRNGRYLYPILEKALVGDPDPRRRVIAEFDLRRERYTGRTWDYRVDTDTNLVADAQAIGRRGLLVLERDDFDGDRAVTKRVYRVNLGRTDRSRMLAKRLVVDLLKLDNPGGLGAGGGWGTGEVFSFGLRSVETLVPLGDGRLLIASDTNYPGDAARRAGTPDDTEMILVDPEATVPAYEAEHQVIAHRGASGYRPEHTLAAYSLAIRQCADVIEPDIVLTKDNVPVARHENEISSTTDVAGRPEFAARRTTKIIDGSRDTGWFTEDFTLAELRTLRARERVPNLRPANAAFDGLYPVPTLAEVLDLARHSRSCSGKPIGVAPETKHPSYFARLGLPMDQPLLRALTDADLNEPHAPVIIQSFEVGNLQRLNSATDVPLAQLINCSGRPWDLRAAGDPRTYADLATAAGLREIAGYADAVGFCKDVMIPRDATGRLAAPSAAVPDAHATGLTVIGWTFRRENQFLPVEFRSGPDPAAPGDLAGEIRAFLAAGMDAYFTDNPDIGSSLDIA
jgi:glycerophosphoryl diester phosphodiesterase